MKLPWMLTQMSMEICFSNVCAGRFTTDTALATVEMNCQASAVDLEQIKLD